MAGKLKLYVVPASHPCAAVEKALRMKGLAYDRVDLMPVFHVAHQRVRFGKRTVPGLTLPDGEKVVGSTAILRVLEGLEPAPPLLPADDALRAKVEAAERWGDETLQPLARRVLWTTAAKAPRGALNSYSEDASLPVPDFAANLSAPMVIAAERMLNRARGAEPAAADLRALPGHLDRIDAWIAGGVLGGEQVNVGDLQIASSLRLLLTIGDLEPLIASRPAGQLALHLWPEYPGRAAHGAALRLNTVVPDVCDVMRRQRRNVRLSSSTIRRVPGQ